LHYAVPKNSASGKFDGLLPLTGSFLEVSTNRETGFSPGKFTQRTAQSHFVLVRHNPTTVGKRAGGGGKGLLVVFINRWNNLDAPTTARPPHATTIGHAFVYHGRDLHAHRCADYKLTLSPSIRANPIDVAATNAHNSYILPRQTRLVARAKSYTHIDFMSIISAHVHLDLCTPPPSNIPNILYTSQCPHSQISGISHSFSDVCYLVSHWTLPYNVIFE